MVKVLGFDVAGPLAGEAAGFAEDLTTLGYAPTSVVLRLRLLDHLSRWLLTECVDPLHCDEEVLARFLVARKSTHKDLSSARALSLVVTFLRSVGALPPVAPVVRAAPGSVGDVLDRWGKFLASDREFRKGTIAYYQDFGRSFLNAQAHDDVFDVTVLDAHAVASFVREVVPAMPRGSAKLLISALRSLLRFLFLMGMVSKDLSPLVPARAGYRDAGVPRGLSPEHVIVLVEAAQKRDSPTGRRDLAVVLLLVRLGLRAGEVARLCLDDVDWRAGTLRIMGKGGRIDLVPLPVEVGAALAAHLQSERRPGTAGREVFTGATAPYRPATATIVTGIARRVSQSAGLGRVGSHQLRHSVATATINAGASWEEVSQLLRHRSLASTAIYAKVDLTRLRTLAQPWPGLPAGTGVRS